MSQPPSKVRDHLFGELTRLGLIAQLGSTLFPPINWHQSLSDRFEDDVDLVARLLSVGPMISARAPRIRIDGVESHDGPQIHWAFKPEQVSADFKRLLDNIKTAIATVYPGQQGGHTAHVTVSYWAPYPLPRMVQIEPIEWVMNEVLLVRGGGDPYRYEVLGCWPLQPPETELTCRQTDLF